MQKTISKKERAVAFAILTILAGAGGYVIYDSITTAPPCDVYCDSCSNCMAAISDPANSYICMNATIPGVVGDCINDPDNFTGKTFDCDGYMIDGDDTGAGDFGIHLNSKDNNTIKNCIIQEFYYGIYLYLDADNNQLINNTANNNNVGISLYDYSNNNTLTNNTANYNGDDGIYLWGTSNSTLTNNTANYNGDDGIWLEDCLYNNLTNNTANNNTHDGIWLSGGSYYNTLTNNTANYNTHDGLYMLSSTTGNIINSNTFCSNGDGINYFDIRDSDSNTGDDNTCNTTSNWDDTDDVGCTYYCGEEPSEQLSCVLVYQSHTEINDTTEEEFNIIVNCTDPAGINITKVGDSYAHLFITETVDLRLSEDIPNYFSVYYPDNNLSDIGIPLLSPQYQIWRAGGRNKGIWYDDLEYNATINNDSYGKLSYRINDGRLFGSLIVTNITGPEDVATKIQINYRGEIELHMFNINWYLCQIAQTGEIKNEKEINGEDIVLAKRFDNNAYKGVQNYTQHIMINLNNSGNTNRELVIYYCNSSYDISTGGQLSLSENCGVIQSLSASEAQPDYITIRNSSYFKITQTVTNGQLAGVTVTPEYYLGLTTSLNIPNPADAFMLRYMDGETLTNLSFDETNVTYESTDNGNSWDIVNWTPDIFSTSLTGEEQTIYKFGIYVEDIVEEDILITNITEVTGNNRNISSPVILIYNSSLTQLDTERNKIHTGTMGIYIGIAIDPDSVGSVSHNLTLRNTDGTYNTTINGLFYSGDDGDLWVYFDTTLVPNGDYKTMVVAIPDDNPSDVQSFLTENNFTIRNVICGDGLCFIDEGIESCPEDCLIEVACDPENCLINTINISATTVIGNITVYDSSSHNVDCVDIEVQKTSDPIKFTQPGEIVTYLYNITNTGCKPYLIEDIQFIDNKIEGTFKPNSSFCVNPTGENLNPTESITCSLESIIYRPTENTVNASTTYLEQTVWDIDTLLVDYCEPLEIDKTANATEIFCGDTIEYTLSIYAPNCDWNNLYLKDTFPEAELDWKINISSGQNWTYSYTKTFIC